MKNYLSYLIFLFVFTSCSDPKIPGEGIGNNFDVKQLISEQVQHLISNKPVLKKTVTVDQKTESQNLENYSKEQWENEFFIFHEMDISHPEVRDLYQQKEIKKDDCVEIEYTLKNGQNAKVQTLQITQTKERKKILAYLEHKTLLSLTQKTMELVFSKDSLSENLQSYSITGSQKLLWTPETTYEIQGKLAY